MRILSRCPLLVAFAVLLLLPCGAVLAESRFSFAATPGKLPKDVIPTRYRLRIAPDAGDERFEGRAEIDIEVAKPVASITLNAAGLSFDSVVLAAPSGKSPLAVKMDAAQEIATLTPPRAPIAPGRYRLEIAYAGAISRHTQGFYRIDYRLYEAGRLVDKVMLATQMEPVHARKLFPGWDEPAFRATFEISAVVRRDQTVFSNMPMASEVPRGKELKEVAFERSVSMPTYLVALFIGEMDALRDSVDGIPLAIYTARGKAASA
ncbi:MAG TPA: hypothetical protein VN747_06345, partial [Burkholderiales bacterium]|nr:hypothetical protein [Burkholderiales bacterium]